MNLDYSVFSTSTFLRLEIPRWCFPWNLCIRPPLSYLCVGNLTHIFDHFWFWCRTTVHFLSYKSHRGKVLLRILNALFDFLFWLPIASVPNFSRLWMHRKIYSQYLWSDLRRMSFDFHQAKIAQILPTKSILQPKVASLEYFVAPWQTCSITTDHQIAA